MKTYAELSAAFDNLYETVFRPLDDEAERNTGQRYTQVHKNRIISELLLAPDVSAGQSVLEIGPSIAAPLVKNLTGAHVETLAIDSVNKNFLDICDISLHVCDVCRNDPALPSHSFDCILFCQVLEHFDLAPHRALASVMRLLKPDGKIFFSVPNFACIDKRYVLLRGGNPQDVLHSDKPWFAHVREPVYHEAKLWWAQAGAYLLQSGFSDYEIIDSPSDRGKRNVFVRRVVFADWQGLVRFLFHRTRRYFYMVLTPSDPGLYSE